MPRIDYRGFCTAMNFEYCYLVEAEGNIEIEDIGNVCLRAYNDRAQEYYLLIIFVKLNQETLIQTLISKCITSSIIIN